MHTSIEFLTFGDHFKSRFKINLPLCGWIITYSQVLGKLLLLPHTYSNMQLDKTLELKFM
jgi:hypothetical protein